MSGQTHLELLLRAAWAGSYGPTRQRDAFRGLSSGGLVLFEQIENDGIQQRGSVLRSAAGAFAVKSLPKTTSVGVIVRPLVRCGCVELDGTVCVHDLGK